MKTAGGLGPLRVLRDPEGRAQHNMAVDGALLRGSHPATLRLYGWQPPAWSLGRFQDPAAVPGLAAAGLPWVRRETGGGAILHRDELTYALVGAAALLPADLDAGYALVHEAIRTALAACGVRATRVPGDAPAGPGARALRGAACFALPARHDLIAPDGRKLLGSAQRRLRRPRPRILIHGSLPIARRPEQPFVATLQDQRDPPPSWDELADAVATAFADALQRRVEPDAPHAAGHAATR